MFTPEGEGYSREVRTLDWEKEADDADRMRGPAEVALEHFSFPFAGREWDSFFDFQLALYYDGRIPLSYGPQPQDPDEAFGDGIVGVFTTPEATGPRQRAARGRIPDPPARNTKRSATR